MAGPVRRWPLHRAVWHALFVDVPFLIDAAWRRIDFHLNSECGYRAGPQPALLPRPCWRWPPFWLFVATVLFVAGGPTLNGVCGFAPPQLTAPLLFLVGGTGLALILVLLAKARPRIRSRLDQRFGGAPPGERPAARRRIAAFAMWAGALLVLAPALLAAGSLALASGTMCERETFSLRTLLQLGACAVAIAAFAVACSRTTDTTVLLLTQAAAISALAAIQWWWLAGPDATEAQGGPYRHVFGALAPAVSIALCFAPLLARWRRKRLPGSLSDDFRRWLPRRELFQARRDDPQLTGTRIVYALFQGTAYRVLQFALPPALLALVAPADLVGEFTAAGLVFALLLSTWGNLTSRWRQMVLHVDRWFLSGAAFFVSLFVIALALLRIGGVDYVTTILDAAPYGVVFKVVAMGYVLAWLMEYWVNRVAALELLRLLGGTPPALHVPYEIDFPRSRKVRVRPAGAYVMCNGIGRFVVVGTQDQDGPPQPAYHSYDILELFRVLAGDQPEEFDEARMVARHSFVYFFGMNLLLAAVIGLFVAYGYWHITGRAPAEPVVVSQAAVDPRQLKDLADRLLAAPGDERPALVLAASGGGTRAALYTAHILEGLHRKGATGDIVLASGVSGGGVALAYFTAHYDSLAADRDPKLPRWAEFRRRVSRNFIRDVLDGASEWRVIGPTPLSTLLAESFERRLLDKAPRRPQTFEFAATPALILNTAITGHPAEDSEALARTLDGAQDCTELGRPYTLLQGGRLIFTNLRNTSAFPRAGGPIPDVRLPYRIVQDPAVPLARAAALTANFPPVFPSAGVTIRGYLPEGDCPDRSYFVTDGGAQENLGLVSALFAVRSALEDIRQRCGAPGATRQRDPWCERRLRPIHFVLAEASAASYDYEEDRGISAATSAAKERMTGGLTNLLIEHTAALYASLAGAPRAGSQPLRFHHLALPLVFRARGGFGTHWMHAQKIEMRDPRLRAVDRRLGLPWAPGDATVTLRRREVRELWTALHDPQTPFCSRPASSNANFDKVSGWICGAPGDPRRPRDLHADAWQRLLAAL